MYPNECCRCGFCCLHEMCPVGQIYYLHAVNDDGHCPGLSFDGDVAVCALAPELVPIGDGCCMAARCYRDGVEYDFASLPREMKKAIAQRIRKV